MKADKFGGQQARIIPESLLFDAIERIGRIRDGRLAVHIHLSRLLSRNSDDSKIRIAFRMFEGISDTLRGQLFLLGNNDIVLICKDARLADVDAMVYRLRALFSQDPLTYSEGPDGQDRFASIIELEYKFDMFFEECRRLKAEAEKRQKSPAAPKLKMLDASNLTQVISGIVSNDIPPGELASIVRRQPCIQFKGNTMGEVLFQEFFVSISDLQRILAPDVNLLANRWLFQHLSQTLDARVMGVLEEAGFRQIPSGYSLNLNLSSVTTPAFERLERSVQGRSKLFCEFQMVDVINDLDRFFEIQRQMKYRGHKTILDGMSALALQFVDVEKYGTDYVKLTWTPDLVETVITEQVAKALGPFGLDRVILSRCDSENAVAWGLSLGISHFQGRFLDSMVSAVTVQGCNGAIGTNCTIAECAHRRGGLGGNRRTDCADLHRLDFIPNLEPWRAGGGR